MNSKNSKNILIENFYSKLGFFSYIVLVDNISYNAISDLYLLLLFSYLVLLLD